MTYDDDALKGILGILRIQKSRIDHIYGIPVVKPPSWQQHGYSSRRPGNAQEGFASVLLWKHELPACRRPNFPSWSWVGWDGVVDRSEVVRGQRSPYLYEGCKCTTPTVSIVAETKAGELQDWDTLYQGLSRGVATTWSGVLRTTMTIKLRLVEISKDLLTKSYRHQRESGLYAKFDMVYTPIDEPLQTITVMGCTH